MIETSYCKECMYCVYMYMYVFLFFQQDVQKENESFKVQIQELKQESCKQVRLPVAVLLSEVKAGGGSLYGWCGQPVVVLAVPAQGQLQG